MAHFIPARDELLFDAEPPEDRLVPYQVGMACLHWEADIVSADDEARVIRTIRDPAAARLRESGSCPPPAHR